MSVSLKADGAGYVLTAADDGGATRSIRLSDTDVLTLAQLIHGLRPDILERKDSQSGTDLPVSALSVTGVTLHGDTLGQAVLMTMELPAHDRRTYALSAYLVERIAEDLSRWVEQNDTRQSTAH